MNPALVEAASVHGVSQWRTLVRIELPLIWPALFSAVIWMFTVAIAAFDVPGVIGMANNIFTFSTAIYFMINPNEGLPRYGLTGAYGTIMVGVSLILMIPYFIALKQSHKYQIISGKAYQSRPVELGNWWPARWGLLGLTSCWRLFCPCWRFLGFVFALRASAIVASALGDHFRTLYVRGVRQRHLAGSGQYALADDLVPTLIVIFCSAISWIVTRSRLRWRVALDAVAFLPHPVPNLLFALAIAYLALLISNVIPLYGTLFVIIAVYVLCWISFGTRVLNNSMIQVHRELEEAAQVGGVSTFKILAKIIAPLIKPGLIYTWIWTSLSAYRELTMAVFLRRPRARCSRPISGASGMAAGSATPRPSRS